MAQDAGSFLPININLDVAVEKLNIDEALFIKGMESGLNENPDIGIGSNNPTNEGQTSLKLTPTRSNVEIPNVILPEGSNKNVLSFESLITQEIYVGNYNSNGNHGIYVFSGNTAVWTKVIVDSKLAFSNDPSAYVAEHRATLRIKKDKDGNVIEKYLLFTDGTTYHKWIDVIAAIKTNGFDANVYPYFALQPPHFDREELLAWAVRSPMVAPTIRLVPNTEPPNMKGVPNKLLGAAFQFCYQDVFTDGRDTLTSPFSLPAIVKQLDFLSSSDLIPKRIELTMDAGSPKLERRNIFVRRTLKKAESTLQTAFGDWYLYDTIYKYSDTLGNSYNVIGNDYWLRTGGWSLYTYDSFKNTIKYVFDNTKLGLITDQDLFTRLGNEMPQLSVAQSNLGDAIQLANNREGFDNFGKYLTDKFTTEVVEDVSNNCQPPLRTLKLYVYVGRERLSSSIENSKYDRDFWGSQVGYYVGDDKQMRFGGQYSEAPNGTQFDVDESKYFDCSFGDKNGFRCYLKGTPYFADCEWYVADKNLFLKKINGNIDAANAIDRAFCETTQIEGGFFVGVFTMKVPAGRYLATLGRHNVNKDGNYRNTSTYIMGIANSKKNNTGFGRVPATAIVTNSKEIEIDCTTGDVDLWGNGADLFYVFSPFKGMGVTDGGTKRNRWQFIEGYLYESKADKVSMEMIQYAMQTTGGYGGLFTDKNGFFFVHTWGRSFQDNEDLLFGMSKNCVYPYNFIVPIANGAGWKKDIIVYYDIASGTPISNSDRYIIEGTITDLTGTIPYSNISVSLKDGGTDATDSNGKYRIVAHNGLNPSPVTRRDNLYVNAAGNFIISTAGCGYVPLGQFVQPSCPFLLPVPPLIQIFNARINAQSNELLSLKSASSYLVGVVGADIAGRVTYVNKISVQDVESFLQRGLKGNTNATKLKWLLGSNLELQNDIRTNDIKWLAFYAINATNYKKYVQWVGDKIEFVDGDGNVTTNTPSAASVKINISSLLNTNIKNNLTLLSSYQFQRDDRLRVYDNGSGTLLNTTTYGDGIDVEILGTNYNDLAVRASLVPPSENTVLNQTVVGEDPTTIIVRYDKRFNVLKDKTGFWIELYTPIQTTDELPLEQIESFYPIINGEIAEYVSGGISAPVYTFPKTGILKYWDTYLINRNINGIGQFITHQFESPNITDTWGSNCTSGGKRNTINPYAARLWYNDRTIKSDDYITERIVNGLSFFRSANIKDFKGYQRGGIVAISCEYSVVFFICENDYFTTDYNYNYIYANAQGVQVANLENNLSVPHQKVGYNFGCRLEDTKTIIMWEGFIFWIDSKNQAAILSDYKQATDVSNITDEAGRKYGIKSYLYEKINAIEGWNNIAAANKHFEISCGIDLIRRNIHVTFRPRKQDKNDLYFYVNKRRNIDLLHQETVVYNLESKRWTRFAGFTPEGYGKVRGNKTGVEFISFAAGKPYRHNVGDGTFSKFYGQQTEPLLMTAYNKNEGLVNIFQSLSMDMNNSKMFLDLVYTTQVFGYSYIPVNKIIEKEKMFYAAFLRDMVSYLDKPVKGDYRSTLQDGKRVFGEYVVMRLIQDFATLGKYFELNEISVLSTMSAPTKP